MIKLIEKLEKSKAFWSLLWISLGFFLLRLPSLFEPNWYDDEGIYQVLARAINHGTLLYSGIWDNKPPLLYLTYALFDGDQFSVRLVSLIVGILTTCTILYLSQALFGKIKISIITTSIFAVLFALPVLEGNIANAENFMLLPVLLAALVIYKSTNNKQQTKFSFLTSHFSFLFTAGFLLGIAFLFKIVAVFDLAAFLVFLFIISFPINKLKANKKFKSMLHDSCFIILGFVIPLLITVLYFFFNHTLVDFIRAAFLGNIGYVGFRNELIIPQGFLLLKLFLLAAFVLFLLIKRTKFSHTSLFVLIWSGFSLFNALFAQRPYTHYILVMLPSFCLLIGLILFEKKSELKKFLIVILILMIASLAITFKFYGLKKTILYYQNAFLFVLNKKDVATYQTFFDRKTARDYELASYIKMHLHPNDPLFIWGDSPQIYTLSKTLPINKYSVAYQITQNKNGFTDTQHALNTVQPKYVIVLPEAQAFPFKLVNYVSKFSLNNAIIYERSF